MKGRQAALARVEPPSRTGSRPELALLHRSVLEKLPLVPYIDRLDEFSSAVHMSPQIEAILGYSVDEWLDDPELFVRTLHPDDRARVLADHARTRATRAPLETEYRLIARDGRIVWFRDWAIVSEAPGGPVLHGYMLEITQQKAADEELRRQNLEFEALNRTAVGLVDGLDLATLLKEILRRAGALLGTEHGFVFLVDGDGSELVSCHCTGLFTGTDGFRLESGKGLAGRVLAERRPLTVSDYFEWSGRVDGPAGGAFHALACVPLVVGSEVLGVFGLAYAHPERVFGPAEVGILERFGRLAAVALTNARLYSAAQQELADRKRAEDELHDVVARLRRSQDELARSHEQMMRRLSAAAEFRDAATGRHLESMGRYCAGLASALGLSDERVELIRLASPLHDVGKIGVPDSVLLKAGPLTPDERRSVESHCEIGHSMLDGSGSPLLDLAATIALTHHERFDGSGYPRGLTGTEIPLEGRIAAVADVFDALTSDRPYRPAFGLEATVELMRAGRGTQFDPLVLDQFLDSLDELCRVADQAGVADPPAPSRSRRRRRKPTDPLAPSALRAASERAEAALKFAGPDPRAVQAALGELCDAVGPELLASVYVRERDRLWLVAQHGYERVRDGFSLEQGVMGRAVREGVVQLVVDLEADPDFIPATPNLEAELAYPFGDGPPAAGVLNIETRTRPLPAASPAAFAGFAAALAAWAEARARGRTSHITSLARLFVDASSLRTVPAIAEFSSRVLGRLLDLESAQLNLGRGTSRYALASFWRRPESALEPMSAAELERLAGSAGEAGTTYSAFSPGDGRWLIWLPLRVAGDQIGVLVGTSPRRIGVGPDEAEAATLLAQHAAALLDGAQALQRERRAAVTDPLTGLLNRRGFHDRFREELRRADRLERPVALIVFDCDDLKAANDRGGHALGDALLQATARTVKSEKRLEDVAGRIGGDEFALLLPEVTASEAMGVAERLRAMLAAREAEGGLVLTATFGVASFPRDGETTAELLRAADRAMYRAKEQGKNRTAAPNAAAA